MSESYGWRGVPHPYALKSACRQPEEGFKMEHTHDAWILGIHPLDAEVHAKLPDLIATGGDVIVHDLAADTWKVITRRNFNRYYEWITAPAPLENAVLLGTTR